MPQKKDVKKTAGASDARREKRIAALVTERQKDFGRDATMASIVKAWAQCNSLSLSDYRHSEHLKRLSGVTPAGQLHDELLTSVGILTLKDVEVAFENLIEATRKRAEGVVYTPNYIIDYLVNKCADSCSPRNLPRLLDPACGGGGFIIRAVPILAKRYGLSLETVVNECVYGVDISPDAVECSAVSLELLLAEHKITSGIKRSIFHVGDTLINPAGEIFQRIGAPSDGFDLITTNPPYVKLQNLEDNYRRQLESVYKNLASGSYSLAMLFLIAGHRMLNRSGELGYITQNNLFTSLAGQGVREYLQEKKCLHSIVDFEHSKVFNNASAYTCLIFLNNRVQESLKYATSSDPKNELQKITEKTFHSINICSLNKKKWRLAAPHHLENIELLERNGIPLGSLADIRVGFATLKDSVFLLNREPDHLRIEDGITTPAIKIAEFKTEIELARNIRRIIQPYYKSGKRWLPLPADELRQKYPIAYQYLESKRAELAKRGKGKKLPKNFYEWGRSQCMEAPGPKLLTKTFSKGPNFLLDETDNLFCNGYSVRPKAATDLFGPAVDIRILQIILNSSVMDYYTRLTAFQIEGGYQCFQKNFIERICIPQISPSTCGDLMGSTGVERQKIIAKLFQIRFSDIMEIVPGS
jgi:adenine-specific DNA-methyltransferase